MKKFKKRSDDLYVVTVRESEPRPNEPKTLEEAQQALLDSLACWLDLKYGDRIPADAFPGNELSFKLPDALFKEMCMDFGDRIQQAVFGLAVLKHYQANKERGH